MEVYGELTEARFDATIISAEGNDEASLIVWDERVANKLGKIFNNSVIDTGERYSTPFSQDDLESLFNKNRITYEVHRNSKSGGVTTNNESKVEIPKSTINILAENMRRLDNVGHNKNNIPKIDQFNGWASMETKNIAENLNLSTRLFNEAIKFMDRYSGNQPYRDFIQSRGLAGDRTNEGIGWINQNLDYTSLNKMMVEL